MKKCIRNLFLLFLLLNFFACSGAYKKIGKNVNNISLDSKEVFYREGIELLEKEEEGVTLAAGYFEKEYYFGEEFNVFRLKIKNTGTKAFTINPEDIYYIPSPEIAYEYEYYIKDKDSTKIPVSQAYNFNYTDRKDYVKVKEVLKIEKVYALNPAEMKSKIEKEKENIELNSGSANGFDLIVDIIDIFDRSPKTAAEEEQEAREKQEEQLNDIKENQEKIENIKNLKVQELKMKREAILKHTLMPGEELEGNIYFSTKDRKNDLEVALAAFEKMNLLIKIGDVEFDFVFKGEI